MREDQLSEVQEGQYIAQMLPYIEREVAEIKAADQKAVMRAVGNRDFSEKDALQMAIGAFYLDKLVQKLQKRVNRGETAGEVLDPLFSDRQRQLLKGL